jgi:Pentapeptide repeats (8 copies)
VAGLFVAAGLYFTARTYQHNRESAAQTYELEREGQITDRFTSAIEHLGSSSSEVRVGGIYALGRIMRDSADDQGAVVDVLIAFVREHATMPDTTNPEDRPTADVRAALNVLGRRPDRPSEEADFLRLESTYLPHAWLRNAQFSCVRLRVAYLANAHMENAILEGARMREADLSGADLAGANLKHANLREANMSDVSLERAQLWRAHLAGVTGDPPLTPEQKGDAHCLPTEKCGDHSLPADHRCKKYDPE